LFQAEEVMMESQYYDKLPDGNCRCRLCAHACVIKEGRTGLCRVRRNVGGQLIAEAYGRFSSVAIDPIEKKPLARYKPGSRILSIGSYGCNMACPFCQNWQISQAGVPMETTPGSAKPRQNHPLTKGELRNGSSYSPFEGGARRAGVVSLVEMAEQATRRYGSIGVAFTYNEPLIDFEYLKDALPALKQAGQDVVLVSNGMANPETFAEIVPCIDAINVDLKAFDASFYRVLGGDLASVKQNIEACARAPHIHVEVTTLVVPGLNDDLAQMAAEAAWLAGLDPDITLHLTRYFPNYHQHEPSATPLATLQDLRAVAQRYLHDVLLGNV
jgi:pyruvate formate lyase activating enzyme